MQINEFAALPFRQASQIWLGTRAHISDRTRHDYRQYFAALNKHFGDMPLNTITLDHLWSYQKKRNAGEIPGLKKAGNTRTNHEMNGLTQVLDYANLWDPLKKWFNPLPVSAESCGIALTQQEEDCLFPDGVP